MLQGAAMETIAVQLSVPKPLSQQLDQTARLTHCDVQDVMMNLRRLAQARLAMEISPDSRQPAPHYRLRGA